METAFNCFDTDGNGKITVDELQSIFDFAETKDKRLWKEIMEEVDTNKDNVISFQEFATAMEKVLTNSYFELSRVGSVAIINSHRMISS